MWPDSFQTMKLRLSSKMKKCIKEAIACTFFVLAIALTGYGVAAVALQLEAGPMAIFLAMATSWYVTLDMFGEIKRLQKKLSGKPVESEQERFIFKELEKERTRANYWQIVSENRKSELDKLKGRQ